MRPSSEWDDFHSTKVWGVFGVVDCTTAMDDATGKVDVERRQQMVEDAINDFRTTLAHFKQSAVRRLIVFVHSEDTHHNAFVLNDIPFVSSSVSPTSSASTATAEETSISSSSPAATIGFSVGHVPERSKPENTRMEARAQVTHFAGLVLNEIDAECWRRRESPSSELFLSPIDENLTTDRQSKLAKRRAGRLDKLLGDSLLLMGSPAEALVKYTSAMERSKASSDRLWLAGAMEGWAAAHVLAHVGNGGTANDTSLTNRLIEHFAEIYKLYQKKRVVEPEVVAAMRLAEYLGTWTDRRRAALDAAQHAATVGEKLRGDKTAVLWEALAQFSDRMGCRRKAALYLYRLGQLNARHNIPSSAVTLMVAAERQLCTADGRKPWSSLNRRVLLIAAHHAENAGDVTAAATLYVDALVTSLSGQDPVGYTDQAIVKSLAKLQLPSYLPAAVHILQLDDIAPCQMYGLAIRRRKDDKAGGDGNKALLVAPPTSNSGPFIYNPFEAKKRAKAAADAKRSVTWVRDEEAYVSLRLVNNIGAELVVDIIAVLFNDVPSNGDDEEAGCKDENATAGAAVGVDSANSQQGQENTTTDGNATTAPATKSDSSTTDLDSDANTASQNIINNNNNNGAVANVDEEGESAEHTALVRKMLDKSTALARTVPESMTVYAHDRGGTTKYVTVTPRKAGPLYIDGVLVRIFNGALVLLRPKADAKNGCSRLRNHKQQQQTNYTNYNNKSNNTSTSIARTNSRDKPVVNDPPPVSVMHQLPKVHISARFSVDGEYESRHGHGLVIFDGERRFVWIDVRNTGTEKITWMRAVVSSPDDGGATGGPAAFRVLADELTGETSAPNVVDSPGGVRTFRVELLGVWDHHHYHQTLEGNNNNNHLRLHAPGDDSVVSHITVLVEYEGAAGARNTIRESSTQIRVVCKRAIGMGRLAMFQRLCGHAKPKAKPKTMAKVKSIAGLDLMASSGVSPTLSDPTSNKKKSNKTPIDSTAGHRNTTSADSDSDDEDENDKDNGNDGDNSHSPSAHCMAVEVRNYVSVPARVCVVQVQTGMPEGVLDEATTQQSDKLLSSSKSTSPSYDNSNNSNSSTSTGDWSQKENQTSRSTIDATNAAAAATTATRTATTKATATAPVVSRDEEVSSAESIVEHDACARLVCDMSIAFETQLRDMVCALFRQGNYDRRTVLKQLSQQQERHQQQHHSTSTSIGTTGPASNLSLSSPSTDASSNRTTLSSTAPLQLVVRWALPAMGREGVVTVDAAAILRAAMATWDVRRALHGDNYGVRLRTVGLHAHVDIALVTVGQHRQRKRRQQQQRIDMNVNNNNSSISNSSSNNNSSSENNNLAKATALRDGDTGYEHSGGEPQQQLKQQQQRRDIIHIGSFASVRITVTNRFNTPLPQRTALDVDVGQSGDTSAAMGHSDSKDGFGGGGGGGSTRRSLANAMRGVVLVGMTKAIPVGPLCALQQQHADADTDHNDDDKEKTNQNRLDVVFCDKQDPNDGEHDDDQHSAFSHTVKVRVTSAGCFELTACLYDLDGDTDDGRRSSGNNDQHIQKQHTYNNNNADDDAHANLFNSSKTMNIIYPQTVDSKRPASTGKRRKRLIACAVYRFFGVHGNADAEEGDDDNNNNNN